MGETLNRTSAVLATAGILALSSLAQAAYISVNFQGDAVGGEPSGYNTYTPAQPNATNFARVADSTSTPADPFGGTGNKSLMIQDDSTANDTRIGWQGAPGGLVSGVFKTKFYLNSAPGFTTPYFNIRLGRNGLVNAGTGDIAMWLLLSHPVAPGQFVIDNTDGPYNVLDNAIAFNTVHSLEIQFNSVSHTFTGTLDGNPLTANGGTKTTWNYYTNMGYIDSAMFNAGSDSIVDNRIFVDDMSLDVIPEPSLLGIAGLGLAAVMGQQKRR